MSTQPKAIDLADRMERFRSSSHVDSEGTPYHVAVSAELRRQHAEIERLTASKQRLADQLEKNNPLIDEAAKELERLEAVNAGLLEALQWIELVFTDESMAQEREAELWLPMVRAAIERAEGGKG